MAPTRHRQRTSLFRNRRGARLFVIGTTLCALAIPLAAVPPALANDDTDPCAHPTISGTNKADRLTGTDGNDIIAGGDGEDYIDGAAATTSSAVATARTR
jgi:hypothetical protein